MTTILQNAPNNCLGGNIDSMLAQRILTTFKLIEFSLSGYSCQ